jgi:hypothetical protein
MKDSSLDAYQSILDKLSDKRKKVLDVIRDYPNGIFDKQISMLLGWDINRVTGRRGELEKMGLIESVGRKISPYSKIPVHHWKVSDPEKAVAESKRVKEKTMTFTKYEVERCVMYVTRNHYIRLPIASVKELTEEWINQNKEG